MLPKNGLESHPPPPQSTPPTPTPKITPPDRIPAQHPHTPLLRQMPPSVPSDLQSCRPGLRFLPQRCRCHLTRSLILHLLRCRGPDVAGRRRAPLQRAVNVPPLSAGLGSGWSPHSQTRSGPHQRRRRPAPCYSDGRRPRAGSPSSAPAPAASSRGAAAASSRTSPWGEHGSRPRGEAELRDLRCVGHPQKPRQRPKCCWRVQH